MIDGEGAKHQGAGGAAPGIRTERVTEWLEGHVRGFTAPCSFTRIGEGQSAFSYLVRDRMGSTLVLRRPPIGDLLESAHDMSREYGILASLQGVFNKIPRVVGYCDDLEVTGAPFYLMEFVDGLTLNRLEVAQHLSVESRRATGESLIRTLADLQSVDLDRAGLANLRRSSSFIQRQLRRWTRQWYAQKTRELPLVEELARRFEAQMPQERETVLVHGDYGLHNVVMGHDGLVQAVLDWELTTVGDPLADLGQMLAYWNESGAPAREPNSLFREPVTELPGFVGTPQLAQLYATVTCRDLEKLGYWMAFAYWKTAIIVEGVYSRWLADPANGTGAGELNSSVPRLAELASDALEGGV
jgi:aminoglycoside phosphotransferase (APT) family kinase protein